MRRKDRDFIAIKGGLHAWTDTVLTNPSITDVLTRERFVNAQLRRYQRNTGIAYYNLHVGSVARIRRFLLKYVLVILPAKSNEPGLAELKIMIDMFREDQPIYHSLFTKLISAERFTLMELVDMSARLNDGHVPLKVTQGEAGLGLEPAYLTGTLVAQGVIRTAYYSLLLQSPGSIKLAECALAGCANVFSPHMSGHVQRFCTDSCKQQAYRRRKGLE